jgi:hypothetical protein
MKSEFEGMHIKVKDPLLKSLPAFTVFSLSLILALISLGIMNL